MKKHIYYLTPSSFCFGVQKAIHDLNTLIKKHPEKKIYCIHEIVHNPKIVAYFEAKGVIFVEHMDEIQEQDRANALLVFSAHGTNRVVYTDAQKQFSHVTNLECPFVTKIYREAEKYLEEGIRIFFYIGKQGHQEAQNITDYLTSQGAQVYMVLDQEDIPQQIEGKIALLSQTTLNYKKVVELISNIQEIYPDVFLAKISDICRATYERQTTILQHQEAFESLIVIGGKKSSNTKELYEIGKSIGKEVFFGESLSDVLAEYDPEALEKNSTIAVTGGASTPIEDIQEVIQRYKKKGYEEHTLSL